MQQETCYQKWKLNPKMQKKSLFWCLHEIPWLVMPAILHKWPVEKSFVWIKQPIMVNSTIIETPQSATAIHVFRTKK